jgi:hypothetical protein
VRPKPAKSLRGVEVKEKGEMKASRSASEPGKVGLSIPEGEREGPATVVSVSCGESRSGIGETSGTESPTHSAKMTEGNNRAERGF